MSGFLQRVISAAQSPGGSIHPMLASKFSSSAHQSMPEDLHGVPAGTASLRRVAETTPIRARAGFDPADPGPVESDAGLQETGFGADAGMEESDLDPASRSSSRVNVDGALNAAEAPGRRAVKGPAQSIEPLSNPSRSHARNLSTAAKPREQASQPAIEAQGSASEPALRRLFSKPREAAAQTAETTGAHRYSPLMPASPPRSASPVTSATRRAEATDHERNVARHPRPPPREADDIQIHIGRIEVTAAAAAPAPPAAAARRKSPSLDEYLKRRPGRAG